MSSTDAQSDIERLLQPFPGDNPAGEDLRSDRSAHSRLFELRDTRAEARTLERRIDSGETDVPSPQPVWRRVEQQAEEILAEHARDLEVAAYLIETLVRRDEFPGLRRGFCIARRLVEGFWDSLYPLPDDDGFAVRFAQFQGLNGIEAEGTLPRFILNCPITDGISVAPRSTADFMHVQQIGKLDPAVAERRTQIIGVTPAAFQHAVDETSPQFFTDRYREIQRCLTEFDALCRVLDEKCGQDAPHSSRIRSALENCQQTVVYIAGPDVAGDHAATDDADVEMTVGSHADAAVAAIRSGVSDMGPSGVSAEGVVQSREEAIRRLIEVADYFRRAEPHSPLSWSADQLARWAQLPLPQLLVELIPDETAQAQYFSLAGIPPHQPHQPPS